MAKINQGLYAQLAEAAQSEGYSDQELRDVLTQRGHTIEAVEQSVSAVPQQLPSSQVPFLPGMTSPGMPQPNPATQNLVKGAMESPAFLPVAGTLAAGLASGGLSLPAQALATGLGAGAGTAIQQAREGGASTIGQGLVKTGERGLEAAAMSMGLGLGVAGLSKLAPQAISFFSEVPVPVIKRVIERGLKIVGVGSRNAETTGAIALKETQDAINAARSAAGIEVRNSLVGLHKAVGGKPVIDLTPTRAALSNAMKEAHAADPRVAAAGSDSVLSRLRGIAKAIKDNPNASPAQAVAIRRRIDDFVEWSRRPLAEPVSALSQRAAKSMRTALAQSIDDAGKAANYTKLSEANAKFSAIDDAIDNAEVVFRTPNQADYSLSRRFVTLAKEWSRDGGQAQAIENVAQAIPQASGPINRLIDSAAIREVVQTKPSGALEFGKIDKFLRMATKYLPAASRPAAATGKAIQVGGASAMAGR